MNTFEIDHELTFDNVNHILQTNAHLRLSTQAVQRIGACRQYLDSKMESPDVVFYGINTGFGALCNTRISADKLEQLQYNLLRSHACGTGEYIPRELVRLMLLLKIQSLAYGHSGVQVDTVQRLVDMFNHNLLPVVYEQGSLGASGDLAPLAHLCLPLIGEGEVWMMHNNEWRQTPSHEALQKHGLYPIQLQSKEALALINGTQFMGAFALWCVSQAELLWQQANRVAALSVDGFDARPEPFHPALHAIRPHTGQVQAAGAMRQWLHQSPIHGQTKTQVQDPYAFRCIPQVHGASFDAITHAKKVVLTEINAVTDNPNVFATEDLILSGGNFHGQPLALALDFLAIALAELGSISERRTYQLISGQRGLPAFLTPNAGLHSGLMIPQYTAASIVSQNKQLCTPASVDSIVSSNGQEDHVSMGANAATKCLRVLNNTWRVLGIELLTAAQAIDLRRPLQTSPTLESWFRAYREQVPFIDTDRLLQPDMERSTLFLQKH